jgi:hypothetical protein
MQYSTYTSILTFARVITKLKELLQAITKNKALLQELQNKAKLRIVEAQDILQQQTYKVRNHQQVA